MQFLQGFAVTLQKQAAQLCATRLIAASEALFYRHRYKSYAGLNWRCVLALACLRRLRYLCRQFRMADMLDRRQFVSSLGAFVTLGARHAPSSGNPRRPVVIDGLGEVHLDYPPALLDEMRASGMRACVVTVGNPALQGATAFEDMRDEIAAYDAHIPTMRGRARESA